MFLLSDRGVTKLRSSDLNKQYFPHSPRETRETSQMLQIFTDRIVHISTVHTKGYDEHTETTQQF